MRTRTLATAGFVALALTSLPALAQSPKGDRRDTNKDGVTSTEEKADFRRRYEERFRAADTNRDGGLSRAEVKAANSFPGIASNFDAMDTNKDGKVTIEERFAWGRTQQADKRAAADRKTAASKSATTTPPSGGLQPQR